ncbi:MAG: type II toxin-antitoxin system HipA family toxin [Alkalimonas sp.]|nr:type II toxin-antitoxin system HipA family toxin [Alkalimonas sp.]
MVAKVCEVLFDGFTVGALSQRDGETNASFEYTAQWIRDGFSISPIHMPLRKGVFTFPALSPDTYKGLPAVFADSLPDDFGNAIIDTWRAQLGLDPAEFKAIDRLLYTGSRGMGALEYQPAENLKGNKSFEVNLAALAELAQSVLDDRKNFETELKHDDAMTQLLQIGTSAGGARPKALIAMNKDRSKVLSGQVDAPDGFEHYLLKFDGMTEKNTAKQTFGDPAGYTVMEYVYYLMAHKECGIDMMECDLLPEAPRRHFYTRRFDRVNNQKYHVLTLCAMDHADFKKPGQYSYEQLLMVARKLDLSFVEQEQIFKRMVFNVVARNQDDHTKNISFFVDDMFRWSLAPAYDIAWSYKPGSDWVDKHQMSINGKRDDFKREDLLAVAKLITNLGATKANDIIDHTIGVVKKWPQLARQHNVPKALIENVTLSQRLTL